MYVSIKSVQFWGSESILLTLIWVWGKRPIFCMRWVQLSKELLTKWNNYSLVKSLKSHQVKKVQPCKEFQDKWKKYRQVKKYRQMKKYRQVKRYRYHTRAIKSPLDLKLLLIINHGFFFEEFPCLVHKFSVILAAFK